MEEMRINKYLASIGIASRREIDRLIDDLLLLNYQTILI